MMVKNLSEKIRQDIFMVHIQGHGTNYGVSNELSYAGDNTHLQYTVPSSVITNINAIILNLIHDLPNLKFISCGTCQTGIFFSYFYTYII